jgi:hypothetical protein
VWYEKYFQWYSKNRIEKVFEFMTINRLDFELVNIFDVLKEYDGFLLHQEIEKAKAIVLEAGGISKVKINIYPKTLLKVPIKEAWEINYKLMGGK